MSETVKNQGLTHSLPAYIAEDIAEFLTENHLVSQNSTPEAEMAQMRVSSLFDAYCTWNGIVGYADSLTEVLDAIRAWKEPKPVTLSHAPSKFHHAEQFASFADAPRLDRLSSYPGANVVYIEGRGLLILAQGDRDLQMADVAKAFPGKRLMFMGVAEVL